MRERIPDVELITYERPPYNLGETVPKTCSPSGSAGFQPAHDPALRAGAGLKPAVPVGAPIIALSIATLPRLCLPAPIMW
jgi:hypothetical protein